MTLKYWISLCAAFLLINGLVFMYYRNAVQKTGGEYVYPLDDTYIHLAVAKNAALFHTWGATQYEFTSSSSAPLWTFLLSVLIKLCGDNAMHPLAVNIVFGNLIIILLRRFLKKDVPFLLGTLFLGTPVLLHIQILSGMEHTMHIFVILLSFMLFSRLWESGFKSRKYTVLFLALMPFLCLTRYESMFFVASIIVILLLYRQYALSFFTLFLAFFPVVLFGVWSVHNGGFFVPNSLLMKGDSAWTRGVYRMLRHYAGKLYFNVFRAGIFIFPAAALFGIAAHNFVQRKQFTLKGVIAALKEHAGIFVTAGTVFLHALFASFGWLYRYEAYLLALLYLAFVFVMGKYAALVKHALKSTLSAVVSLCFLLSAAGDAMTRFVSAHNTIRFAGKNIHDQQIQMARFLRAYYNDAPVVANDIGAITYYTNIKLLDLAGLGSNDVLKNSFTTLRGGGGGV